MKFKIIENSKEKHLRSPNYNWSFNKETGMFARWGKTKKEDPQWGLPEIADIEITTICSGPNGIPCKFCYKGNTPKGINMTIDTYKQLLDKLPNKILNQVAFGADATLTANPDIWKIMEHTREKGIIPNVTCANISDEVADNLAKYCGAVAISRYENKDWCYDSIKKLTDRGMNQINIHMLVAEETYDMIFETFNDIKTDPRLEKLNAIVLLSLKQKGRGTGYTPLSQEKFTLMIQHAISNGISFGGDSCSAHKIMTALKDHPNKKELFQSIEPCESSCFSSYINMLGEFYPCSFAEGEGDWQEGLNVLTCNDFIKDVWFHEKTIAFRKNLLKNKRNCPLFEI